MGAQNDSVLLGGALVARSDLCPGTESHGHRLRLLSYNIQAGIASTRYRHYLTYGWKHVLPYANRWHNLDRIARELAAFDVVGLQEVDSGSLRTGFVNQTRYLAEQAGFPFWYDQTNRRVGKLTGHSNGVLSKLHPREITEHRLPGLRGRGALAVRFGTREESLALFIMHLALGRRGRLRQLAYLSEILGYYSHAIVMGDLNCDVQSPEMRRLFACTGLRPPSQRGKTFPSWHPRWSVDHILTTGEIRVERAYVPQWRFSDHLPIAVEVDVPHSLRLND